MIITKRGVADGKRNGNAKLDESRVLRIKENYATGRYTQGELCRIHGVSLNTIGRIVREETWAHVQLESAVSVEMTPELKAKADASLKRLLAMQQGEASSLPPNDQARAEEATGKGLERLNSELAKSPEKLLEGLLTPEEEARAEERKKRYY